MAYRLCERTKLRRGLTPRSYQVTARLAVDAVWAISRSSRQIIPKAFQPVSPTVRPVPRWPESIIAVSPGSVEKASARAIAMSSIVGQRAGRAVTSVYARLVASQRGFCIAS